MAVLGKRPHAHISTGVTWHTCEHCTHKSKTKAHLKQHLADVHDIGVTWHTCEHCTYRCKQKSNITTHLAHVHDIGVTWHTCAHCTYRCKHKGSLTRHLADIHDIGVTWHTCEHCTYTCKRKSHLKEHLAAIHDIGDHECPVCMGKCATLTPWVNPKTRAMVKMCRKCYNKATGKNSRIEKQYSDFFDAHFGTEFLLGSDQRVRGAACQKYRPDKLYASPSLVIHVEIDEHQHLYNNGNYTCDEKRISDIYDEFPGKQYVVIRVNPHAFTPPKIIKKLNKKLRMALALKVMQAVSGMTFNTPIHMVYMFYSWDNPRLSQNIPRTMLYDEHDVMAFCSPARR